MKNPEQFLIGFCGGSILTIMVVPSFPILGSLFIGLLFGLMYWDMERSRDKIDGFERVIPALKSEIVELSKRRKKKKSKS